EGGALIGQGLPAIAGVVVAALLADTLGQAAVAVAQIAALGRGHTAVGGVAGLELHDGLILAAQPVGLGAAGRAVPDTGVAPGVEGGAALVERAAPAAPFVIQGLVVLLGGLAAEQGPEDGAEDAAGLVLDIGLTVARVRRGGGIQRADGGAGAAAAEH